MCSQIYQSRCAVLTGFSSLVEELGGNNSELLTWAGLPAELDTNSEQLIPYDQVEKLLEHSAQTLQCSDFGLRLAAKQDIYMLGALGLLLENCPTVGAALSLAQTYISTHVRSELWQLQQYDKQCIIQRQQLAHASSIARQSKELSLAVCVRLLRALAGSDFEVLYVNFTHDKISRDTTYTSFFQCPVRFNQEHNQIGFSKRFLQQPVVRYSPETRKFLLQRLEGQLNYYAGDLLQQVNSLILQTLGSSELTIATIANFMGLEKRTLQRRLADHGTTFKTLLSDARTGQARWLLHSSQIDITRIAELLGYSDITSFSRAFKTATGVSPRQWRNQVTPLSS